MRPVFGRFESRCKRKRQKLEMYNRPEVKCSRVTTWLRRQNIFINARLLTHRNVTWSMILQFMAGRRHYVCGEVQAGTSYLIRCGRRAGLKEDTLYNDLSTEGGMQTIQAEFLNLGPTIVRHQSRSTSIGPKRQYMAATRHLEAEPF
jgi:hypothetical protein